MAVCGSFAVSVAASGDLVLAAAEAIEEAGECLALGPLLRCGAAALLGGRRDDGGGEWC